MSKRIFGFFILAALLLPVAAKADSISPAWDFSSITLQGNGGTDLVFGVIFTPTVNFSIDYLGYFYSTASGMTESHLVGLYDSDDDLLASTTINSSSTQSGNFLYNYVTPVELLANQTYVLEGISGIVDYYTNTTLVNGYTLYAPITITGYTLQVGSSLTDDSVSNFPYQLFGPDMGLTPEPNSLWLLGSGLAGLAGLIKRKLMA